MSGSLPMVVDGRNLTHRYGQFVAVDDVTLQVRPGETMGLLGPNGAGKTTTINMLCTLTTPSAGRAEVAGFDVVAAKDDVRRHIGLVFQDPNLFPWCTVRGNI